MPIWDNKQYGDYAATAIGAGLATAYNAYKRRRTSEPTVVVGRRAARRTGITVRGRTTGRTTSKYGRSRETAVPGAEYTRNVTSIGVKPRENLREAWRLLKSGINSTVYGHNSYSKFGSGNGIIPLANISASTSTGNLEAPVHLWDITQVNNVVDNAVVVPNVRYTLTFNNPTDVSTATFTNTQGQLTLEDADFNISRTANYPGANDRLDWMQAKLLFYAPTTMPTKIQIDIVSFTDMRCVPDAADSSFKSAFWQAMAKPFLWSPLESGDRQYAKYVKVHYTQSFIMNPKEQTENTSAIYREIQIFKRMNLNCDYKWADADGMALLAQDTQMNYEKVVSTQVHPLKRVYLMIRGQSGNSTGYTGTTMPTYDIRYRVKHSQFST